jgi:hypothetical protein
VAWLPGDLRSVAAELLTSGKRLAQEAVGTELLSRSWTGLAGLDSPL